MNFVYAIAGLISGAIIADSRELLVVGYFAPVPPKTHDP